MKRIVIFLIVAAGMFPLQQAVAQSPQKMNYQAVVRNDGNELVTDTQVGIQIKIFQGSADGTLVYEETQTPTTNANGLLTIEIGGQTGFDTIMWADGPYFIETGIDPEGGTDYAAIQGTSPLLTVPYALHAKSAEGIKGKHYVGELMGNNGEDGVVFWVDETREHGLICSPVFLNDGEKIQWYNGDYVETGTISLYDGSVNTSGIISTQGDGSYAAKLCTDYATPGTSAGDWYLPAVDELSKLFQERYVVNKAAKKNIVSYNSCWTSTESDIKNDYAWVFNMGAGAGQTSHKDLLYKVRAVRAF